MEYYLLVFPGSVFCVTIASNLSGTCGDSKLGSHVWTSELNGLDE